jgi:hypothetical protein
MFVKNIIFLFLLNKIFPLVSGLDVASDPLIFNNHEIFSTDVESK